MASHLIPPPTADSLERRLTREEGWNLIYSLFGTAKELYAPYGGGEAWLRSERAAWSDEARNEEESAR